MDWTLRPWAGTPIRPGPLLVIVMDGIGLGQGDEGDAVALARTPVLDRLFADHPWLRLKAHGTAVGLPSDEDMGNSEVGHNALGAGRVFDQGAKLVNAAIANGAIFNSDAWRAIIARARAGGALHLIGLLSDGNVHSHQNHLHALIARASEDGARTVFVHILLDGRDVPATSALEYVDPLEAHLARYNRQTCRSYRIASGGGRMVTTMDRYEADWCIVERGWNAHVHGWARHFASAREAIETYRSEISGVTDQYLPPFVIAADGQPVGPMRDGDSAVFFNFRGDRALQISKAFERDDFPHFHRGVRPDVFYAGMMQYDAEEHLPAHYLVTPPQIERTIGEYLARNGIRQFACSETQKFGHVTYFWNGNRTGRFDSRFEEYLEIPSYPPPFDQRPQMRAPEIAAATIERLRRRTFQFGRINFANGDMVGHTGNREAAIQAVEAVDHALGRLLDVVREVNGIAIVTADHGNSDDMFMRDKSGAPRIERDSGRPQARPSHSLNPVPFILFDSARAELLTEPCLGADAASEASPLSSRPCSAGDRDARADAAPVQLTLEEPPSGAGLANVAATCLNLLGFEAPADYAPSLVHCDSPPATD